MTYSDDALLPISALQHLIFCERQCALIHLEQIWSENLFTAQGRVIHEKVHSETIERRRDIRVEYGMPIRSLRLGLTGKADVVEFHHLSAKDWKPFPVEYKRGKPKTDNSDSVQLCAQAMCLEEMLELTIPKGAIYYGKDKRRIEVIFDDNLRHETVEAALRLHELMVSGKTPPPVYDKKCDACSLFSMCLPKVIETAGSVKDYLTKSVNEE